jgi:benzoate-CoA ligase
MNINFAKHIIDINEHRADKLAITDGKQSLSYGQMTGRIRQMARSLANMHIKPGQTVIISMEDCVDWPVIFLGAIYVGAVPVPVAGNIPNAIFNQIVDFVDGQIVFADAATAEKIKNLGIPTITRQQIQTWFDTVDNDSNIDPFFAHPDSPVYMGLSSGSTGLPKIAVFRHQVLFDIVEYVPRALYGMDSSSVMLSLPKMSWGYGLHNTITYTFGVGATAVVISDVPGPTVVYQTMNTHNPTILASTPAVLKKLLGPASKKYNMPNSIVRVQSSGEALPESIYDEFYQRFGIKICASIGQLEVANTHYATTQGEMTCTGVVGKPLPGVKIKILNKQDQECALGDIGEIYVSSNTIASYYLKNYKTTKSTFFGDWVKTGDTGFIDTQGNLIFVGRMDDVFKVNDLIVSPIDVENQILKYPNIENIAIIGIKTDISTQVHAFVIAKDSFDLQDFDHYLKSNLLGHQLPTAIHLVDQFPETVTGKKDRKTLGMTLCAS